MDQVTIPERVKVDVTVVDQGSIVMLYPQTSEGVAWIDEHIGQENGCQPYYPTVVCEHRFADNVIDGMIGDGLAVD